tara:strand:+ start:2390 stop:2614 length:225 start_codon:yes stop_codon:yes gene_type:complete
MSLEEEIEQLKKLAGIYDKDKDIVDGDDESNISITGSEKRKIERDNNIQPGTPEWFKLWFSLPKMTGEKPFEKE